MAHSAAILPLLFTLAIWLPASGSLQMSLGGNASNTTRNKVIFATLIYEQTEATIHVAKNNPIATIDIYDNMICSMNVRVHSIISHQAPLQNILQIGNSKKNENYPSIFIDKNPNNGFKIRMTNAHMSRHTFFTHNRIELNTTHRMKIQYTQHSFAMELNGLPLYFDSTFDPHLLETDKTVYAGNPWHDAADAHITDLHIYGWNNPHDNAYINHNLESQQTEATALNEMLDHLSAPWIVVSVLGMILLMSVVCLGYVNYQKLTQYRNTCAIPKEFEGKRTLRASTSEIIQHKIQRMQNDAAHLDEFNLDQPCIDNEPVDIEWRDEFYGNEPTEFPDIIADDDIVTPI